jgi:SAM-dependent methyltransferase
MDQAAAHRPGSDNLLSARRLQRLAELGRSLPFEREISRNDRMLVAGDVEDYHQWGLAALDYIKTALGAAEFPGTPAKVLDFASGHGRVARMLRAAFPRAEITVSDLDPDAVEFCARTFDATPVLSHELPDQIALDGAYQLIWVGSLFTHLASQRWDQFIGFLCEHLEPGGVLLFTTLGRTILNEVRFGRRQLAIADVESLVTAFDTQGFAYQDYAEEPGYGIAVARPWWVCGVLMRHPTLELVTYGERGWNGRQDAIACRRVEWATAQPAPVGS